MLFFSFFFFSSNFSRAEERITITTFYPTASGGYRSVRLSPQEDYPTTELGNGLILYRTSDNAPAYMNNTNQWVVLTTRSRLTEMQTEVVNITNNVNNTRGLALNIISRAISTANIANSTANEALRIKNDKLNCTGYTCPACPNCDQRCPCTKKDDTCYTISGTFYKDDVYGPHGNYSGVLRCRDDYIVTGASASCTPDLVLDDSYPLNSTSWLGDCSYKGSTAPDSGYLSLSITCCRYSR